MERDNSSLDFIDIQRIQNVSRHVLEIDTTGILREMLPQDIGENTLKSLCKHLEFIHEALLVFSTEEDVKNLLKELGYSVDHSLPSAVVKLRIAERYCLDKEAINIRWLHGTAEGKDGRPKQIEIFFLPKETSGLTEKMINNERKKELESHVAFKPINPEIVVIRGLKSTLISEGGFTQDGGGVNLADNPEKGGTTILYFLRTVSEQDVPKQLMRLEIVCPGNYKIIADENQS